MSSNYRSTGRTQVGHSHNWQVQSIQLLVGSFILRQLAFHHDKITPFGPSDDEIRLTATPSIRIAKLKPWSGYDVGFRTNGFADCAFISQANSFCAFGAALGNATRPETRRSIFELEDSSGHAEPTIS
jgi:hypothetical protein